MAHLGTTWNEYAKALGLPLFDDIPKTVLAAIAVSVLTTGGEQLDQAAALVCREWQVLYDNGIVTQRPSARARAIAAPLIVEPT